MNLDWTGWVFIAYAVYWLLSSGIYVVYATEGRAVKASWAGCLLSACWFAALAAAVWTVVNA